jgi:hypothetical protein
MELAVVSGAPGWLGKDLGYDPEVELEEGRRHSIALCRDHGVAL